MSVSSDKMSYNGSLLYFSSRKINPSHSEIPNFYKYKQIIKLNPMAAIEYSSCYNSFFMDKIQLLNQMNYSISFILQRENKLIEHKGKLESFKGKPFYETLQSGIEHIEKEIRSEKEILRLYLKDYEMFLYR